MANAHGTWQRYAGAGCRCTRCRAAWADYYRARARKLGRRTLGESVAARRMGLSRTARPRPAYYAGKRRELRVRVTPLAEQLLRAAYGRTGHDWDDVVEALVRQHAATVTFDETAA